jgi:SAM-dependent methyltransferase
MTSEVVAEIQAQVRELRARGLVPPGLEDELDECFEEVAEASLDASRSVTAGEFRIGDVHSIAGLVSSFKSEELFRRATVLARRRLGPSLRRLERRSALGVSRVGQAASIRAQVTADHLERLAARSAIASGALSAALRRQLTHSATRTTHPEIEGPLLAWVLERLSGATPQEAREAPGVVLHAECGDGRIVEALAARGLDARGADPSWPVRASGEANIVAAGALEYLGATQGDTFDGLLLTGVVDRMRPGAARALAQLAARCLAPGGVVVLVSARPEVVVAMDPVAADLAPGRPLHPVTWCHLLARYGLSELAVFEPDASEPDVFAVSARRPVPVLRGTNDRP